VGLFRSSRPVFRTIGDALGLLEANSATVDYENGPVRPRLDVQASIEAGANLSEFILLRTDVGAVTDIVDVDVHVLADWTEIRHRNATFVGVAGTEVPPTHDAWILYVGVSTTLASAYTASSIFSTTPTVGAGDGNAIWFFADTVAAGFLATRTARFDPPNLIPLPWYIPPEAERMTKLQFRLVTSAAVSTNLTFGVLSAPAGTFKRLY